MSLLLCDIPISEADVASRCAAPCARSGPYQRRSYIVGSGSLMGGCRMTDPRGVHESVAAIAASLGGTVGVAARNLASGAEVHIAADDLFPMASCFKIPVMVEVMRRVDAGSLRLDDRVTLTEADKSPGSTLIHCHEGLRPSVRDLLYLMITLSDNTATDMLWRHGRPGLRQRDHALPRAGDHRLLHAQPRVLPHRGRRRRGVGRPLRRRDRRPLAGDRGARRLRGRVPPRPRGERAPQRRRLPAPVRAPLGPRRVAGLRGLVSPSTRRSTTRAPRATSPSCSR